MSKIIICGLKSIDENIRIILLKLNLFNKL